MCKTSALTPCRTDPCRKLRELRARGEPLLPVKAPPHYRRLVEQEVEELGRTGGPLHRAVYPIAGRFETFAPGEVVNFVEDFDHMPAGLERVLVHRYPGKCLYFPTDDCVGHCQYCFRPDVTGAEGTRKNHQDNLTGDVLDRVVAYLCSQPRIREVILSGGDPLACPPERLAGALRRIREVPTVRWIRLHTRAPIFAPSLLDEKLLDLFERYDVKVVLHVVHPYELTPETEDRLRRLRRRGILAYNQFPLLRGINDHPAAIMELGYALAELGVQMLSMFIADPIRYGAVYRLRLERAFGIAGEVFRRGEAWISNFRVCLDTPIGKVRREHLVHHDPEKDLYTFERDCRQVDYPDIPAEMDRPTPLEDLLYHGSRYVDARLFGEEQALDGRT